MSSDHHEDFGDTHQEFHAHHTHGRFDFLLWGSVLAVTGLYLLEWQFQSLLEPIHWLRTLSNSVFELMNTTW